MFWGGSMGDGSGVDRGVFSRRGHSAGRPNSIVVVMPRVAFTFALASGGIVEMRVERV